jgi:hypothetical protein
VVLPRVQIAGRGADWCRGLTAVLALTYSPRFDQCSALFAVRTCTRDVNSYGETLRRCGADAKSDSDESMTYRIQTPQNS